MKKIYGNGLKRFGKVFTYFSDAFRGTYCAISVAKLTNLEELDANIFENVAEWIALCQTYEGGFGAIPGAEAHGGYTYCGVASLKLLGKDSLLDVDTLLVCCCCCCCRIFLYSFDNFVLVLAG